jgi:hypothetical protein
VLLGVLLGNHHDDDVWAQRVRELMQTHGQEHQADSLIDKSRESLKQIHADCIKLFRQGGVEQAISMLNEAADSYPGNRTITLMSVSAMLDFMREHGVDDGYQFRCRFSLNRLLERNRKDETADKYLRQLTQLPVRAEQEN